MGASLFFQHNYSPGDISLTCPFLGMCSRESELHRASLRGSLMYHVIIVNFLCLDNKRIGHLTSNKSDSFMRQGTKT